MLRHESLAMALRCARLTKAVVKGAHRLPRNLTAKTLSFRRNLLSTDFQASGLIRLKASRLESDGHRVSVFSVRDKVRARAVKEIADTLLEVWGGPLRDTVDSPMTSHKVSSRLG